MTKQTRTLVLTLVAMTRRRLAPSISLLLALSLLAGCKGSATGGEKEARRKAETVAKDYQPHGQKPTLPALSEDSSPMVGGVITSTIMELVVYPAIYYLWRSRSLKALPAATQQ